MAFQRVAPGVAIQHSAVALLRCYSFRAVVIRHSDGPDCLHVTTIVNDGESEGVSNILFFGGVKRPFGASSAVPSACNNNSQRSWIKVQLMCWTATVPLGTVSLPPLERQTRRGGMFFVCRPVFLAGSDRQGTGPSCAATGPLTESPGPELARWLGTVPIVCTLFAHLLSPSKGSGV